MITRNRRCFNDGYHVGHHPAPTRHWTDLPGDFPANREHYAVNDAIVLAGLDNFMCLALWRTAVQNCRVAEGNLTPPPSQNRT